MRTLATCIVIMSFSASSQIAVAQNGTAPFCFKPAVGKVDCTYATMGQCEQARGTLSGGQCITQSDAHGTTGLGDSSPVVRPNR